VVLVEGERSGLVCVIEPADPIFERLRLENDPHAIAGVPAHVTCLAPFVPPRLIDAEVLGMLGDVAAAFEGFPVHFPEVREFPGVVWLRPEPEDRFRALTRKLAAAFPDYPPYEGAFPDPQPHMTVGMDLDPQTQAELREQVDREVAARMPFEALVTSMSLLVLDLDGTWHEEARFAFRASAAGTH
jgi:2'-5' RNA ligase